MDATTQTDPLDLCQQMPVSFFNFSQNLAKFIKITIFTIVVYHETADLRQYGGDFLGIAFAQTAVRAGRVGQIVARCADPRVEAQATGNACAGAGKSLKLGDGVEDDFVGIAHSLGYLVIGPGHAIGVGFAAKLLAPQAQLK